MAEPAYVNGFIEGSDLMLLYRDERGEMRARRKRAEWSSFYRARDVSADVMRDLRNSHYVLGVAHEKGATEDWVRVKWQAPEWRRAAHKEDGWADAQGLVSFEADVSPERRYFAETPGAQVARPRRCYVDIETDSRVQPAVARKGKARVLAWAIAVDDEPTRDARDPQGVRIVAARLLAEDSDQAEHELLEAFWQEVEKFDQLAAWYGDGFDFPILRARADFVGARHKDFRRWLYVDHMVGYERMNRNAAESGAEKESLTLDFVARELLGEGKLAFDASKTYEEWAAGGERREAMLRYCCQDVALLPRIERKTGYLELNATLCEMSQCFQTTRNFYPIPLVDGFLLRMGRERGLRFPTVRKEEEGTHKKFAGAFVLEPQEAGILRNVHVFDFSGMYPSIMLTWNMSPETRRAVNVNGPIDEGHCRAPSTRAGFVTGTRGIVPEALLKVRQERKYWQKLAATLPGGTEEWVDANRRSNAYKVMANIFYGACGSPVCRFFDRVVAESVSQNGAWLIRMTLHEAEKRGWRALYGDTDSGFVSGATREEVAEFVEWCNRELYPKAIADCGCTENHVEVAYEKEFDRISFGAKKRYWGVFRHYKWTATCECNQGKRGGPGAIDVRAMACKDCGRKWEALPPARGKPEIKGYEYKRGDANVVARRLQYRVIERLASGEEDPEAFSPMVEEVRKHILEDPLPIEEVRESKSISKSLREYKTKEKKDGSQTADLPHVQVAKILKERGELVEEGTRIQYYVVDAAESPMTVAPAGDYAQDADRYHLWESRIYPATQRVLEAAFPVRPQMTAENLRARDFERYLNVRPKTARTRKVEVDDNGAPKRTARPVAEAQRGLFDDPPPAPAPQRKSAAALGEP